MILGFGVEERQVVGDVLMKLGVPPRRAVLPTKELWNETSQFHLGRRLVRVTHGTKAGESPLNAVYDGLQSPSYKTAASPTVGSGLGTFGKEVVRE